MLSSSFDQASFNVLIAGLGQVKVFTAGRCGSWCAHPAAISMEVNRILAVIFTFYNFHSFHDFSQFSALELKLLLFV